MAKNKLPKQIPLPSPENYIRQKARNLPIHQCLINEEWKASGTAHIVIARRHVTGNITHAMYLVDLLCLGVRDTVYDFNMAEHEYDELIAKLRDGLTMQPVDYTLAHNIIFAAVEFANDYGFKPQKDFTSVTQYLLQEDTDDVELMEIECGRDGKPVFICTDAFTDAEASRIISQLQKTAGQGNFEVIYADDDEMDALHDEYKAMTPQSRKMNFLLFANKNIDQVTDEEHLRLIALTQAIYLYDLTDDDTVNEILDKWEPEIIIDNSVEEYTAESLGLEPGTVITEEQENEFFDADFGEPDDPDKTQKAVEKLWERWGEIPYLCYKKRLIRTTISCLVNYSTSIANNTLIMHY